MNYEANNPEEYINLIPKERQVPMEKLRKVLKENLPEGIEETISYGMIGYVIPKEIYPEGYHVNPELPLPFISIASQKNFIGVYHMGIYYFPDVLSWFKEEYAKLNIGKLDMGKSCIRLKKIHNIPYELIGALSSKISIEEYVDFYITTINK